jgi:glycosyltransferase involved in cell wall biosynthesis
MTTVALPSYVLITPARNEVDLLEAVITSVLRQTVRPLRWVIVSDGSTDGTDELVKKYASQHAWIEFVRAPEHGERHFAGKVAAFNAGYAKVKELNFDVIGNLDADVTFSSADYFASLMDRFAQDPRLGVCGTSYEEEGVLYPSRFTSVEDVFGACQMFRRDCFDEIGGYLPVPSGGIDLIAFLSAREKGWQTRTFLELRCEHHRKVGSGQHANTYERMVKTGRKDYMLGCHPLWQFARCAYLMKSRPHLAGGLMLVGYFFSMLCRVERTIPKDLMKLRQKDQMLRLKRFLMGGSSSYPNEKGTNLHHGASDISHL